MHLKLNGKVSFLSQIFNTTFVEYKCGNETASKKCFASNSEVTIPETLKSSIIGIMGLEQVLNMKPNFVANDEFKPAATSSYFIPTQVASIYGFPSGTGSGITIGIISFGGFFKQSDLQAYFTRFSLGTAPTINIVFINGAQLDYYDTKQYSSENYLDVEIIASLVPSATITMYFAPNSFVGMYDALYAALSSNNVVSLSWGTYESKASSYWSIYKALLLTFSNVPIFVATGDNGSKDGIGFPASVPNAIGNRRSKIYPDQCFLNIFLNKVIFSKNHFGPK
jgi:kumamolisin